MHACMCIAVKTNHMVSYWFHACVYLFKNGYVSYACVCVMCVPCACLSRLTVEYGNCRHEFYTLRLQHERHLREYASVMLHACVCVLDGMVSNYSSYPMCCADAIFTRSKQLTWGNARVRVLVLSAMMIFSSACEKKNEFLCSCCHSYAYVRERAHKSHLGLVWYIIFGDIDRRKWACVTLMSSTLVYQDKQSTWMHHSHLGSRHEPWHEITHKTTQKFPSWPIGKHKIIVRSCGEGRSFAFLRLFERKRCTTWSRRASKVTKIIG